MKITVKDFNCETGEETIIEREETAQEQAEREAFIAKFEAEKAEAETKATAKADLLAKLGITAEEAKLLLS
jgi:hypothetical protein